jgi:hypothetical protein
VLVRHEEQEVGGLVHFIFSTASGRVGIR